MDTQSRHNAEINRRAGFRALSVGQLTAAYWQLRDLDLHGEAEAMFGLGLPEDEADHGDGDHRAVYRTEVEAAWQRAYADWENGRATSPSAFDLVMLAEEAMGVAFVDQDALATALWNRQCEGGELTELADWLLDHGTVGARA